MQEIAKDIISLTKDIKNNTPLLLIGEYMTVFKKLYKGNIKTLTSMTDVRDLVADYTGIRKLDKPLIIEDLGFLSIGALCLLLKLIEDSKFSVILLSTFDQIPSTILSRVKVFKKAFIEKIECEFMTPDKGIQALEDYLSPDTSPIDRSRWIARNSPMIYYIENNFKGKVANRDKVLNILFRGR